MTDRSNRLAEFRATELRQATDQSHTATAHAQAAKVLTTGVSLSMVLGIVAYMSHSVAVEERIAKEQELQAQLAASTTQAGVAAASSLPTVALTDGTLVGGSTLVPGSTPTAAQTAAGGTIAAGDTGATTGTTIASGSGSGGGTVTTIASGSGGGTSGGSATTQPPVTQAPTTTVPVTVAPTTTVSGGTTTSH